MMMIQGIARTVVWRRETVSSSKVSKMAPTYSGVVRPSI